MNLKKTSDWSCWKNKGISLPMFAFLFFLYVMMPVFAGEPLMEQRLGLYQFQPDKQIQFKRVEELNLDFDLIPLKKLNKVEIHKGLIYLLDSEREKIFIIDKTGKYISTIGGRGEGPGDLQWPGDFFISADDRVYVLNSQTGRIEVFDAKGKAIESIRLKLPFDFFTPKGILVDNDCYYIGGSWNDFISAFDCSGKYIETILKRKIPLEIPGNSATFDPQLAFITGGQRILFFDNFHGAFVILDKKGESRTNFSYYARKQAIDARKFEDGVKKIKGKNQPIMGGMILNQWSGFCLDEQDNIYVCPLGERGKSGKQLLVVFSPAGVFLYEKELAHTCFEKELVEHIACDNELFLFVTRNYEFIKVHRR